MHVRVHTHPALTLRLLLFCVRSDEPSTGMDPMARRKMWDVISSSKRGRTAFLTTHLMEEADALCARIAIMVNGQLACVGSSQHLKSRFGKGYRLELSSSNPDPANLEDIQSLVTGMAQQVTLAEAHGAHMKYELSHDLDLADVFELMESRKEQLSITDYAVAQTTLEQVFLRFAQKQQDKDA